ncbi:MAG: hypothetical protein DI533_00140 [Cereibacter sphaeroides]|uniref:Uncharacterized protein n=1 Tax=Cereibacter sphaeroides TaxID=1063 RepID=A0A2W5TT90_CERSP|nr:MAG: hypothetical protein DI533_00140 [Cereibacter sphaeroides]
MTNKGYGGGGDDDVTSCHKALKGLPMRKLTAILFLALSAGVAGAAVPDNWFRAINGMWVQPETPRKFFVGWKGQSGDPPFWCAAGDYVIRHLGMRGDTPIFRLSPLPRRGGQGIWFSLDAAGAQDRTGVNVFFRSGPSNSVSANAARSFCDPFLIR